MSFIGGLIALKWVEINVCIANNRNSNLDEVLLDLVDKLVEKFKGLSKEDDTSTWHYLWENCQCNNNINLCLVLRFYGEETNIEKVKNEFEKLMIDLKSKKADLFGDYWYGKHENRNEEYNGEEETYGTKGWELVKNMLNFGSEIALELIKNKEFMGKSDEFKNSLNEYVDRYVHLFLNQVIPNDEVYFLLHQFVFRYYYIFKDIKLPAEELNNIENLIIDKINNK